MQGVFTYGLLGALAIALLVAIVTDIQSRHIDNWLNAGIALGAPLFWLASGLSFADIGWQIGIAVAAFIVFAAMFAIGWMGGGDVKLLSALALWIQPLWFAQLIVVMALAGGVLTIAYMIWHVVTRRQGRPEIPYGIAISGAGLWALASQYFPPLQNTGLLG